MPEAGRPSVYVILVNYNNAADTLKCLESVRALEYDNVRVVLVENGSSDDSIEVLSDVSPDLEILHCDVNKGFPAGCNAGFRYALSKNPDYVWALNNDTVTTPGALAAMVAVAERDPRVGAVGAIVRDMVPPHKVQAWGGGKVVMCLGVPRHFARKPPDAAIHYLYGASILLRREVLEQVGLLDEGFFLYWEDTDYGLRIRDCGWTLAVADDAVIYHSGGMQNMTLPRNPNAELHYNESSIRFFYRHSNWPMLPITLSVGARALKRFVCGNWEAGRSVLAGASRGIARRKRCRSAQDCAKASLAAVEPSVPTEPPK